MVGRMLAAAGVAAIISGAAAGPALAAPGERAGAGQARYEAATGPVPLSGEWWFTSWKILDKVWPLAQGAGVTVAVLDTGVQASVPDLRGAVLPGGDVTGHRTNGETDGNGHGTMMSVLIAGQGQGTGMLGVAPKAKILPVVVNAATPHVTADPAAIAAAIRYAASHGARVIDVPQEHPIGSASGCDAAVQSAVAYALARNIVVVAAAGDTNFVGAAPSEPASCAGVLAVTALQPNRALWPLDARQPYLTVANPGADLVTSGRDGKLVTGVSGAEAASALAAGAVALIRSHYPTMPWYQVIQRVTGTALAAGGHVPNDSFGNGIFRLSEAVNATAFPVPASAPNPVYAKYRAWLATPAGQAVTRQLSPSPAAASKSDRPSFLISLAMLAFAVAAVGAAVIGARTKRPGARHGSARNGPRNQQTGTTSPAAASSREYPPDSDPAYNVVAEGYRPAVDEFAYRIPPYMSESGSAWYPPLDDRLLGPDENNP
jgi:hypothetical protein